MKLYYSPFACSLAAHIACREAGLEVELVRVDLKTKRTEEGGVLFTENPMGQVPTLRFDDGRTLTESVAVLSYIGDRMATPAPESARGHANDAGGPWARYEVTRWLSFVSTEIHKRVLWPIFSPVAPEGVKAFARDSARKALDVVATRLGEGETLSGADFTVADIYLFWALMLMPHAGIALETWPALGRFQATHGKRASVREAVGYEKARLGLAIAAS